MYLEGGSAGKWKWGSDAHITPDPREPAILFFVMLSQRHVQIDKNLILNVLDKTPPPARA